MASPAVQKAVQARVEGWVDLCITWVIWPIHQNASWLESGTGYWSTIRILLYNYIEFPSWLFFFWKTAVWKPNWSFWWKLRNDHLSGKLFFCVGVLTWALCWNTVRTNLWFKNFLVPCSYFGNYSCSLAIKSWQM
jgi:hypothetical protein